MITKLNELVEYAERTGNGLASAVFDLRWQLSDEIKAALLCEMADCAQDVESMHSEKDFNVRLYEHLKEYHVELWDLPQFYQVEVGHFDVEDREILPEDENVCFFETLEEAQEWAKKWFDESIGHSYYVIAKCEKNRYSFDEKFHCENGNIYDSRGLDSSECFQMSWGCYDDSAVESGYKVNPLWSIHGKTMFDLTYASGILHSKGW